MTCEPFHNRQISARELPDVANLTFEALEAKYIGVLRIESAFLWLILIVLIWISYAFLPFARWLLITALSLNAALLLALIVHQLILKRALSYRGYAIREHDLTYRKGIIKHRQTTIPYCRAQQVSISQGITLRPFGLHALTIYNASELGSDLTITGIDQETAARIKAFVLARMNDQDD